MASRKMNEQLGMVRAIPLTQIIADTKWNARREDFTEDSGAEGAESEFKDLVASLASKGQDEPVTVRPKGKKFELIAGFRRYAALMFLAEQSKSTKDATINAIERDLSDVEARSLNLRENTARDDLKGPDLAFGVYDLYVQRTKANGGVAPTETAMAQELGKNQAYIGRLLNIMKHCDTKITSAWRAAKMQLSVSEMLAISKVEKDRQWEEYEEKVKGKADRSKDGKAAVGRGMAGEAAKRRAEIIGSLIGKLERLDLIQTANLSFSEHIDQLIKLPKDCDAKLKRAISKSAENAYNQALEESDESEEESEE